MIHCLVTFLFQDEKSFSIPQSDLSKYKNSYLYSLASNDLGELEEGIYYVDKSSDYFELITQYLKDSSSILSFITSKTIFDFYNDLIFYKLEITQEIYDYLILTCKEGLLDLIKQENDELWLIEWTDEEEKDDYYLLQQITDPLQLNGQSLYQLTLKGFFYSLPIHVVDFSIEHLQAVSFYLYYLLDLHILILQYDCICFGSVLLPKDAYSQSYDLFDRSLYDPFLYLERITINRMDWLTRLFLVIVNGDYMNTLTIGVSVQLSEDLALSSSSTMIPNCMPTFGGFIE